MGMISGAGASAFQNTSQIGALQSKFKAIQDSLKSASTLDSATVSKTENLLKDLNTFSSLKSPSVKDFAEIARKLTEFFDHIAEIDESFIREFTEDFQVDRKHAKGKMMTEFLQAQLDRVPAIVATVATASTVGSVEKSSDSSKLDLAMSDPSGPEWTLDQEGIDNLELGDVESKAQANTELRGPRGRGRHHVNIPPLSEEEIEKAGIDMNKVRQGDLGEMAALASLEKAHRASFTGRGEVTDEDAKAAGIDLDKAKQGDLGEVAALAGLTRMYRHAQPQGGSDGFVVTNNKTSLSNSFAKGIMSVWQTSPEDLKKSIEAILKKRNIDLSDIMDLMKLVGELGLDTPKGLLDQIEDALTSFLEDAARNATDLTDFLSLLKTFQALTSGFGDVATDDVASSLSKAMPTQENANAALELQGMGINVELDPSTDLDPSNPGNPLAQVDKAMLGQKDLQIITGDSASFAVAAAGASGIDPTRRLSESGIVSPDEIAFELNAVSRPSEVVTPKSESSVLDFGKSTPEDLKEFLEAVGEKLQSSRKEEFTSNTLDLLTKFMDSQLSKQLDPLADHLSSLL